MAKMPDPYEMKALADRLISARESLAKLEAEWAAFFGGMLPSDEVPVRTLSDRIIGLLELHPEKTYSAPAVASLLSAKANSIGPLLSRLVAERKVAKVGYGEYRAVSSAWGEWKQVASPFDEDEAASPLGDQNDESLSHLAV